MRKTYKYIISFIIISTLCVGGITCNAAIISQDIGSDQFAVILGLSDFNYVSHFSGYAPEYGSGSTTTGVDVHVRYDGSVSYNRETYTINIPLYLTGIENGTIQFCLGSSESHLDSLDVVSYNVLVDGVSSTYTDGLEYLGKIGSSDFTGTGSNVGTKTYYFKLWQITWEGNIDVLQLNVSNSDTAVTQTPFAFGMTGASFLGADVQIATIVSQITNISQGIEQLKIYVDQVESNQITIIGKIEDVIDALSSIEDLKDQMEQILSAEAFDAANGTTIVQDIQVNNSKQVTVLNDLRQYSNILNQYHNNTIVSDIGEVFADNASSIADIVSVAPVATLIADVTIGVIPLQELLLTVFVIVLLSFILFGKKA